MTIGESTNTTMGTAMGLQSMWMVTREGWRLHARVGGQTNAATAPVVLVHGYGVSSSYHVPLAELLSCDLPVYAPDLPGHGLSDKPREALNVPQFADALASWMDAAGLDRASLFGHSMGCQIIAHLAVRHPERVGRLVLVGPTPDPAARSIRTILPRFLATGRYERSSMIAVTLADYIRARPHRLWKELRFMLQDRIEDVLPMVETPAMVIRGGRDRIVSHEWAERVAGLLGAPAVHVVPGWGHALNYSAPEDVHRHLVPFLTEGQRRLRRPIL